MFAGDGRADLLTLLRELKWTTATDQGLLWSGQGEGGGGGKALLCGSMYSSAVRATCTVSSVNLQPTGYMNGWMEEWVGGYLWIKMTKGLHECPGSLKDVTFQDKYFDALTSFSRCPIIIIINDNGRNNWCELKVMTLALRWIQALSFGSLIPPIVYL